MSIHVTVNSNPIHINRGRMLLADVEAEKKNEWNRRRKLRIQQVRQQSKDLANVLREKVKEEQARQHEQHEKDKKANVKEWQKKKLDTLSKQYSECLQDVGLAHVQAASQPDVDQLLREERMRNTLASNLRGHSALNLLKQNQQSVFEKETAPMRQRSMTRAKEDLRSCMVSALPQPCKKSSPIKKKVISPRQKRSKPRVLQEIPSNLPQGIELTSAERGVPQQGFYKTVEVKATVSDSASSEMVTMYHPEQSQQFTTNCHHDSKKFVPPVDLAALRCRCTKESSRQNGCPEGRRRRYSDEGCGSDSESFDSDTTWPPCTPRSRRSRSTLVEHYDHDNRHHSSRTVPQSHVTRMKSCERPCQKENLEAEQREMEDRVTRLELDKLNQAKRGRSALHKQHLRNDFNNLMSELGKLNREERKLRSLNQVNVPTSLGETQRKMKLEKHQKRMESAFESEFCEQSAGDVNPYEETEENCKESLSTPKLNVGEWKKVDPTEPILVQKQKQNDRLTLSNLMQRINQQREMLSQEIRKGQIEPKTMTNGAETLHEQNTSHNQEVKATDPHAGRRSPRRSVHSSPTSQRKGSPCKQRAFDEEWKNSFTASPCFEQNHSLQEEECPQFEDENSQNMEECDGNDERKNVPERIDAQQYDRNSPILQQRNKSPCRERTCLCDKQNPCIEFEDSTTFPQVSTAGNDKIVSSNTEENYKASQRKPKRNSNREMRFPSPILEVSKEMSIRCPSPNDGSRVDEAGTGTGTNRMEKNDEAQILKQKETTKEKNKSQQKCRDVSNQKQDGNRNESGSSTSLTTLYSLDMALSHVSVEQSDSTQESSASMKGLRITVKVSGHKHLKNKNKKKKKNDKQVEETCRKLLEDSGNMRRVNYSGGTSSTSYRSPPDNLSQNQLTLLNSLLQQIKDKGHKKGIPLLKQYILRLLSMSRESIDKLSVSSSDVSLQGSLINDMVRHEQHNTTESVSCQKDTSMERGTSAHKDEVDDGFVQGAEKAVQVSINGSYQPVSNDINIHQKWHQQQRTRFDANTESDRKKQERLDNFDILTRQVNEYFENKEIKSAKSDEIVTKYTELAKRYAERISSLADMIGDVGTDVPCSFIKPEQKHRDPTKDTNKSRKKTSPLAKSMSPSRSFNETSYMSLPPETHVHVPVGQVESCGAVSPTFYEDDQHNISWHDTLAQQLPTHILPAPDVNHYQWYRPKPPPTILNNHNNNKDANLRTCSPHELSTIQEVDTPSTSQLRDRQQQQTPRAQRGSCRPCHEERIRLFHSPSPEQEDRSQSPERYHSPSHKRHHSQSPEHRHHSKSPEHRHHSKSPEHRHHSKSPEHRQHRSSPERLHSPKRQKCPHSERSPNFRPASNKLEDSFLTLKSDEDDDSLDDVSNEYIKNILDESLPDIMAELIRRNIITSPYAWAKNLCNNDEGDGTEGMADEEVRQIFQESPEDLESAFRNLGLGWASATLRKTRQAEELSADSSSPLDGRRKPAGVETSTPHSTAMRPAASEMELSAVRLIASSSSELALTPPDLSLAAPKFLFPSDHSMS